MHSQIPISLNLKASSHHLEDLYTPHEPPFKWAALGDSYTAGPGAGDSFTDLPNECGVTKGNYPYQLSHDFPYSEVNMLQVAACSGTTTQILIDDSLTDGGLRELEEDLDVVVLTIGGNDIGFSEIVRACLVTVPFHADCENTLKEKNDYLETSILKDQMWKVYDGIYNRLKSDYRYQVYHILYSRLFNAEIEWCKDQSLGILPFFQPKLTMELRKKLNDLVDKFNAVIKDSATEYIYHKQLQDLLEPDKHIGWRENRLFVLDPDRVDGIPQFEHHRFCDEDITDPEFRHDRIWFFGPFAADAGEMANATYFADIDPIACKQDSRYNQRINSAFSWDCDVAQYFSLPNAQQNMTIATGADVGKWFHPKTAGFTQIKNMLGNQMLHRRPRHVTAF